MIFTYFTLLYIQFFFCCGAQVDLSHVTNITRKNFHKLLKTVFKFSISEFSARPINKFKQYLRSKLVICEFIFCHFIQSNFFLKLQRICKHISAMLFYTPLVLIFISMLLHISSIQSHVLNDITYLFIYNLFCNKFISFTNIRTGA